MTTAASSPDDGKNPRIDITLGIYFGANRTAYLWHCWSCDYRFEAVAIFDERDMEREALAA